MTKISTEQLRKLQKAKDLADTISKSVDQILNQNATPYDTAKSLGFTIQTFYRNVAQNFIPFYKQPRLFSQADAKEIAQMLESPYDKLFRDIFNLENRTEYIIDYDTSEKIQNVMQQTLSEREIRILIYYYGLPIHDTDVLPHTYEEVAKLEQITKQGAHHIHKKALRKLRSSEYSNQLLLHSETYVKSVHESEKMAKLNNRLDNEILTLVQKNALLKATIDRKTRILNHLKDTKPDDTEIMQILNPQMPSSPASLSDDTSILALHFSTRISNALQRNSIFTFGDLRKKSLEELSLIRGLGDNSIEELFNTLCNEYGIVLPAKKI